VFNSRALAWSSLAVAIAVMLTIMQGDPRNRLAMGPPAADETDRDAAEIGAAEEAPQPDEQPDESRSGETEPTMRGDSQAKESGGAELANDFSPAGAKSASRPMDTEGLPSGEFETRRPGPVRGAPGGPSQAAAATPPRYAGEEEHGTIPDIAAGDPKSHVAKGKGYEDGDAKKRGSGGSGGLGSDAGGVAQSLNGGQVDTATDVVQPEGPYAVVCCDISPKAFQGQAIDRVLAANGIAFKAALPEMNVEAATRTYANVLRAPPQGGQQYQEQKQAVTRTFAYLPQIAELDLVCVEASPEQIEATLTALRGQSDEFLSLSVSSAPGVEAQKDWGRQFGRGLHEKPSPDKDGQPGRGGEDFADTAEADDVKLQQVLVQRRNGVEGERKLPLGSAWRLQVSPAATRGRLNDRLGSFQGFQSGAWAQQPGLPPAAPSTPKPSQPPAEKPPATPVAEPTPGPVTRPADQPTEPPDAGEQPEKAPASLGQQEKPSSSGERLEKSPAPGGRSAKSPASGDRPGKSPGLQKRVGDLPRAAGGGQATQQSTLQETTGKAGDGQKMQEPDASGVETPRRGPPDTDREGAPSPKGGGRRSVAQDEAKSESESQRGQELHRLRLEEQRLRQRGPTYRVLFVLRMVGPDLGGQPPAAAAILEQAAPTAKEE
jgi:hypothetical protein